MKKTLYIIGNVIFYVVIAVLLLFSIANISVKKENQFPSVMGRGFVSVLSDSMNGDQNNSFAQGSLAFVRTLNENDKAELKAGDIVVFYGPLEGTGKNGFIIHRVVENYKENNIIYTQGDVAYKLNPYNSNISSTENNTNGVVFETSTYASVLAVYTGHLGGIGGAIEYLRTPVGFAVGVLMPLFVFLVFEIIILVRYLLKKNRLKLDNDMEEQKARLKQELLEELLKEQLDTKDKINKEK